MTLQDLLDEIYESKCEAINIERTRVRHGNVGGEGDYSKIELTIGEDSISFNRTTDGWVLS